MDADYKFVHEWINGEKMPDGRIALVRKNVSIGVWMW